MPRLSHNLADATPGLSEALWEIFDETRPLEREDIERLVGLAQEAREFHTTTFGPSPDTAYLANEWEAGYQACYERMLAEGRLLPAKGRSTPAEARASAPLDVERLAELEHEQWAHWTRYMLDNLTSENIERWRRQIDTPYHDLSEREKESDREWARKVARLTTTDEGAGE